MIFREALQHKVTDLQEGIRRINAIRLYGASIAIITMDSAEISHSLLIKLSDMKEDAGYVAIHLPEGCDEDFLFHLCSLASVDQVVCSTSVEDLISKTSPEYTYKA